MITWRFGRGPMTLSHAFCKPEFSYELQVASPGMSCIGFEVDVATTDIGMGQ